jgi:hypothetical protein
VAEERCRREAQGLPRTYHPRSSVLWRSRARLAPSSTAQHWKTIGGFAPSAQNDQLEEATQHPVTERHDHVSILTHARSAGRPPHLERESDCRHPQAGFVATVALATAATLSAWLARAAWTQRLAELREEHAAALAAAFHELRAVAVPLFSYRFNAAVWGRIGSSPLSLAREGVYALPLTSGA